MSFIPGPYYRSRQTPGFCRKCQCVEFLAIDSTKSSQYTGREKCLCCPHRAGHHMWDDTRGVKIPTPQFHSPPPAKEYDNVSPEEQRISLDPLTRFPISRHSQVIAEQSPCRTTTKSLKTSFDFPPDPPSSSPWKPHETPLPPSQPSNTEHASPASSHHSPPPAPPTASAGSSPRISFASTLAPPAPPPIKGRVTLAGFYEYFRLRSDHTDGLIQQLREDSMETTTLLNGLYLDLATLQDEIRGIGSGVRLVAEGRTSAPAQTPHERGDVDEQRETEEEDEEEEEEEEDDDDDEGGMENKNREWKREFAKLKRQKTPEDVGITTERVSGRWFGGGYHEFYRKEEGEKRSGGVPRWTWSSSEGEGDEGEDEAPWLNSSGLKGLAGGNRRSGGGRGRMEGVEERDEEEVEVLEVKEEKEIFRVEKSEEEEEGEEEGDKTEEDEQEEEEEEAKARESDEEEGDGDEIMELPRHPKQKKTAYSEGDEISDSDGEEEDVQQDIEVVDNEYYDSRGRRRSVRQLFSGVLPILTPITEEPFYKSPSKKRASGNHTSSHSPWLTPPTAKPAPKIKKTPFQRGSAKQEPIEAISEEGSDEEDFGLDDDTMIENQHSGSTSLASFSETQDSVQDQQSDGLGSSSSSTSSETSQGDDDEETTDQDITPKTKRKRKRENNHPGGRDTQKRVHFDSSTASVEDEETGSESFLSVSVLQTGQFNDDSRDEDTEKDEDFDQKKWPDRAIQDLLKTARTPRKISPYLKSSVLRSKSPDSINYHTSPDIGRPSGSSRYVGIDSVEPKKGDVDFDPDEGYHRPLRGSERKPRRKTLVTQTIGSRSV